MGLVLLEILGLEHTESPSPVSLLMAEFAMTVASLHWSALETE